MSLRTRLKARGFLHHAIFRIRPVFLWSLCLIIYSAIVLIFAGLYKYYGVNTSYTMKSFLYYVYYSVTVQTTIGFGEITSIDTSMKIYIAHSFIAFFSNALLLGILVSSFLQRKNNVICSDQISYNHQKNNLTIWIMNMDYSSLIDIQFTFGVIRQIKDSDKLNKLVRYPVKVKYNPTLVDKMRGFLMITDNSGNKDDQQVWKPRSLHENIFSIFSEFEDNTNIFDKDEIIEFVLEVRAKSVDTGNDVFLYKTYKAKDIVCGEFMDLTDCRKDYDIWTKRKMDRFGKFVKDTINFNNRESSKCTMCNVQKKFRDGCLFGKLNDIKLNDLLTHEKKVEKKDCIGLTCEYSEVCKLTNKIKVQ